MNEDKSSKPLVSIITVCYNSEEYIRDTIESVLRQTYDNIEYIIVDGESTDSTLDIIKEYELKFNGRMIWISEPDDGIYDAMNKGIDMAKGEIIGIINSDDWYCENSIEVLINNYKEEVDIYYGNIYIVREFDNQSYGKIEKPESIDLLKNDMVIKHPSSFVNKRWYKKFEYDTKYKIASDYKFMLNSYLKNANFKYINFKFSFMRLGGLSNNNIKSKIELFLIKKEIFGYSFFDNLYLIKNILNFYYNKLRNKIAYIFLNKSQIKNLKLKKFKKIEKDINIKY